MRDEASHATYLQVVIESEALQLRKILELLAYSSLVSHQDAYYKIRKNMASDWHAARILKNVAKINSEYYPVPVDGVKNGKWKKVRGGFLTKKQFMVLYDKCSDILHAENPFNKTKNSISFHDKVPHYIERIENLISEHYVKLAGDGYIHVIVSPSTKGEITVRYLTP
ncbi:hypothetical protein C8233_01585 [Halomonas sp. SF2003]|nr:hypothetical protein C8233_01585 [Halomonas sp. SF2003]